MDRSRRASSSRALVVSRQRSAASLRSDSSTPSFPHTYSGTQINLFAEGNQDCADSVMDNARHPEGSSVGNQFRTYPYGYAYPPGGYTNNVQLGLVTEHMLRKLDESRLLTMTELMRRTYGDRGGPIVEEPASPRPLSLPPPSKPSSASPGHGDWKGQISHIYGHLVEIAKEDRDFRRNIGDPILGEIISADLEESDENFTLTLSFSKPRREGTERRVKEGTRAKRSVKPSGRGKREEEEEPEYEKEKLKQDGTLKPLRNFNPEADAEMLRKAMKGLGTDENAVSEVMGQRIWKQRQEVIKMYKTMYGKDLVKDLKGELSGEFWKVVRALSLAPPDFDASELRNAIKGVGTDDDTVIEIICTRTNKTLQLIQDSYRRLYNRTLEDDVSHDTSGHYQRLLLSLLQANRDESNTVDLTLAKKDAKALDQAGPRKWGTDESKFNSVLVSRSGAQLRATFREFQRLTGKSIEETVKSEMSGELAEGMLTIVRCIGNKPGYFARQLYKALKGLGTDDDTLIRVVVTRAEVDMVQIKEEFQRNYKQPLSQFIADDISGDYRNILLMLIGSSPPRESRRRQSSEEEEEDSDY